MMQLLLLVVTLRGGINSVIVDASDEVSGNDLNIDISSLLGVTTSTTTGGNGDDRITHG